MGVWVEEENIDDSQNYLSVHNWIRSIECHCLGRRFKEGGRCHFSSREMASYGEYVVIQFETSFENKKAAVETVTPMMDKDGIWRVSGYYIK